MHRLTRVITLGQAESLAHAVGFARQMGSPLNRFLTVLWERASVVGRIQEAQARFLERMRKWLKYRGIDTAWVWVIENGREMGLHSHILVHVPAAHFNAWKNMLPAWVDGDVDAKTIHVTTIQYSKRQDAALNRVKGTLKYLLKGTTSQSAALLGIRKESQGIISGKRTGTSQNLGPAARLDFARIKQDCIVATSDTGNNKSAAPDRPSAIALEVGDSEDPLDIPECLRRDRRGGRRWRS